MQGPSRGDQTHTTIQASAPLRSPYLAVLQLDSCARILKCSRHLFRFRDVSMSLKNKAQGGKNNIFLF
jgi:hypothetical protein